MNEQECVTILENAGIRPTSVRILVYESIAQLHDTFSLSNLEDELLSLDKSSIFRALTLFNEHHLIHSVEDGSGSLKYCVCHNHGVCRNDEGHCHFYCEVCHKTFCLEHDAIPKVVVPEGFIVKRVNYLVKGVCASCATKHKL